MGLNANGVFFFGVVADPEDGAPWASVTSDAFETAGVDLDDDDPEREFRAWLDVHLEVERELPYDAPQASRRERMVEVFGCVLEVSYVGWLEHELCLVHPEGAMASTDLAIPVRAWMALPETLRTWIDALERLRAALPGLGEPGYHVGVQVF